MLLEDKMKNRLLVTGMLAFALVWGMTVVGCDDGSTGGGGGNDHDDGEPLPKSSGINAVGGKTYYTYEQKIVFSATANGAASGTYTVGKAGRNGYEHGKYTYTDIEIGTYSWNEGAKTVTLKPQKTQKTTLRGRDELLDRSKYRKELQAEVDADYADYMEYVLLEGFSSITAFINYEVNEAFSNKTHGYSLSTDRTALFLEEPLPANKGVNELSGKTYYGYGFWGDVDVNKKFVFTASGYTFTRGDDDTIYETITGSYAYDNNSNWKRVWLRPEKIDGTDKAAYYTGCGTNGHHFVDDYAYRAAETDLVFRDLCFDYNATDEMIDDWDWDWHEWINTARFNAGG